MRKKVIITTLLCLAALISIFFVYNKKTDQKEKVVAREKIRVTYLSTQEAQRMVIDIAEKKGFFAKNNIDIEKVPAPQKLDDIISSGNADVGITGMPDELALYLNDAETRLLAFTSHSSSIGVSRFPKDQGNKIKKSAISRFGGFPQIMTLTALKNIGADVKNVQIVAVADDASRLAMLKNGDIDFAIITSKQSLDDAKLDSSFSVYDPSEIINDLGLSSGIITYQKILDQKPQQIKDFVAAIYETTNYLKNNPDETKSLIQQLYGYTPESAANIYTQFINSQKDIDFVPDIKVAQSIKDSVDEIYKPSDQNRDMEKFIYDDFAKQAVANTK